MHDACSTVRLTSVFNRRTWSKPRGLCISRAVARQGALVRPDSKLSGNGLPTLVVRAASSSSSKRWQTRQAGDKFTKEARVQGLMSRAAFKLLEINEKHRIFRPGQTVVDLGYAPGSWSQVAADRTRPGGRVIGIDIIPALPPKGVSTIQGNFLSEAVQQQVTDFVRDPAKGRAIEHKYMTSEDEVVTEEDLGRSSAHVLNEFAKQRNAEELPEDAEGEAARRSNDEKNGRVVDVVLSDMSAPWVQEIAWGKNSLNDPYFRMMNTSGNAFRDHVGSMDLCNAALRFAFDTLRAGGSFVCKYYAGGEDKAFEKRLKLLFSKVHRDKPSSSRSASKEAYFIGLRRKVDADREAVLQKFD